MPRILPCWSVYSDIKKQQGVTSYNRGVSRALRMYFRHTMQSRGLGGILKKLRAMKSRRMLQVERMAGTKA